MRKTTVALISIALCAVIAFSYFEFKNKAEKLYAEKKNTPEDLTRSNSGNSPAANSEIRSTRPPEPI